MSHTKILDNYLNLKDTTSCYLDGRYFSKVFQNYPGLISQPLTINIRYSNRDKDVKYHIDMKESSINTKYPGLVRLIIKTPNSRHSNLLILDYENEKVYRFEPLGTDAPYFDQVNKIVQEYLSYFFDFDLEVIDIDLNLYLDEKNMSCARRGEKTGFCTAYIILYAYAYLHGKEFDPSYIKKFATKIEETYGKLPSEGAEQDMGIFGDGKADPKKVVGGDAIGGLAGGLLVGGGAGILGGALGGGLIGAAL